MTASTGSSPIAGLLLAYLIVAKYCDHLPFYRLQQIFQRRHRVLIDRNAMCHWMGRCVELLERLYETLRKELISGQYLQIDETTIKLLDPDSPGKAKKSFFWVIVRPREGVLFRFDPGRAHTVAMDLLEGFVGKLQSAAYHALVSRCPCCRSSPAGRTRGASSWMPSSPTEPERRGMSPRSSDSTASRTVPGRFVEEDPFSIHH